MPRGPQSFLVLPDRQLRGALTSVTSEAGRQAGEAIPDDANSGDLWPFAEGDPPEDEGLDVLLVGGGGLYVGAEWVWRRGAGLDVFASEPDIDPRLLELDNVVLLPHIASSTVATRTTMCRIAAENVLAFAQGREPPNTVDQWRL